MPARVLLHRPKKLSERRQLYQYKNTLSERKPGSARPKSAPSRLPAWLFGLGQLHTCLSCTQLISLRTSRRISKSSCQVPSHPRPSPRREYAIQTHSRPRAILALLGVLIRRRPHVGCSHGSVPCGLIAIRLTNSSPLCCAEVSARPQLKQKETEVHKLAQRQKQVDYGKNTLGYALYSTTILKCVSIPPAPP